MKAGKLIDLIDWYEDKTRDVVCKVNNTDKKFRITGMTVDHEANEVVLHVEEKK